jgi:hypothetical protein
MKDFEDIEKTLRDTRLPDQDMSHTRHEVWQRIMKAREKRHKRILLSCVKPWGWALASIILILICVFVMILMVKK